MTNRSIAERPEFFTPYADGTIKKNPWNWEHNCVQSEVMEEEYTI